jgi:uncharacterized membrane protein
MISKHPIDSITYSTRRLEALTDGVFAIAMTLLILDLKVSAIGRASTSDQLWHGINNLSVPIVSIVISFLMLASLWATHTRQFEYIKRADRRLIMINNLRLLTVVFLPLTTSITATYSNLVLGEMLLPINFLVITAVGYWQWRYAINSDPKLYDTELTDSNKKYFDLRNKLIIAIACGVVILSAFVGEWAFLLFLIMFLFSRHFAKLLQLPDDVTVE